MVGRSYNTGYSDSSAFVVDLVGEMLLCITEWSYSVPYFLYLQEEARYGGPVRSGKEESCAGARTEPGTFTFLYQYYT